MSRLGSEAKLLLARDKIGEEELYIFPQRESTGQSCFTNEVVRSPVSDNYVVFMRTPLQDFHENKLGAEILEKILFDVVARNSLAIIRDGDITHNRASWMRSRSRPILITAFLARLYLITIHEPTTFR
jgi:hypothetical protein